MKALGEKLKADTKNDRNAFVFIFDDKRAALMRDDSAANKLNEADQAFFLKHFIGEYSRNGNNDYHQLDIYFDGVMGANQKTIQY